MTMQHEVEDEVVCLLLTWVQWEEQHLIVPCWSALQIVSCIPPSYDQISYSVS